MRAEDDARPLWPRHCPKAGGAFVGPDEPMAHGRLVGFDDPVTGEVLVRRLVVHEDSRRVLRSEDPEYWPDVALTYENETLLRGTVVLVNAVY